MGALCAALASIANQEKFYQSPSAFALLIALIKAKNYMRFGCLRALSFVVLNHPANCRKFIESNGIKTLFAEFMNEKKIKKKYKKHNDKEKMEEYVASILVQLFCHLSDLHLARLVNKFKERDMQKIDRLIELHAKYIDKMEEVDEKKTNDDDSDERYAHRLENGLYCLQMIDIVIAFVYTVDDVNRLMIQERIVQVMNQYDMDIDQVKETLQEYYKMTQDDEEEDDDQSLGVISGKLAKLN